jgi:hypothetical protein
MLHQQPASRRGARREQQMHVIGHEAIGMHRAFECRGKVSKVAEVTRVVLVAEEAGATVVAALNDVNRHVRYRNAWTSWHRELRKFGLRWAGADRSYKKKRGLSPILSS